MIVKDSDAIARLGSPMNLINRMKSMSVPAKNAMSLFIRPEVSLNNQKQESPQTFAQALTAPKPFNPFENKQKEIALADATKSIRLDDISDDHDSKIKLGLTHDKALQLLTDSVSALALKLDDVRADRLPSVIAAASKTVESIRRERAESAKNSKDREVHYHFYTPQQKTLQDYEVIEVAQ